MAPKIITVGKFQIGGGLPLAVIAGPCVIENKESALRHASVARLNTLRPESRENSV